MQLLNMKNKTRFLPVSFITLMATYFFAASCNKKFDEPPVYVPPDITANTTIQELKAMHKMSNVEAITDDKIIEGIVVANDSTGNFFKQIIIQDETGGIAIRLDNYNLYTSYPAGRQVFIKLNGLFLGDYNRLIQVGGSVDNSGTFPNVAPLDALLVDQYVVKGTLGNPVAPKSVTVDQLNDSYQNMLIKLTDFEFSSNDIGKTYANTVTNASVNFTIKNCAGQSIILRNSGYASFAGLTVPGGNGSITAIYSVFGSDKQLFIRDTSDLKFNTIRCDGSGTGGTVIFTQDFSGVAVNSDISLPGWVNVAETGTVKYVGSSFSGNSFAKISAFNSAQDAVKSWLVTPAINLIGAANPVLTFQTIDGYDNGAALKAYISADYDGVSNTPWSASWTQLTAAVSGGHASGYASSFTGSGKINLGSYTGNVYVAFVYEGADPSATTTFEIDDVKVTGD